MHWLCDTANSGRHICGYICGNEQEISGRIDCLDENFGGTAISQQFGEQSGKGTFYEKCYKVSIFVCVFSREFFQFIQTISTGFGTSSIQILTDDKGSFTINSLKLVTSLNVKESLKSCQS